MAVKRLALFAALIVVALYVAWRFDVLRWPPFGTRSTETADSGGRRARGAGAGTGGPRGADGPVSVTAIDVQTRDVPISLDAIGTVQPLNTVTVRTQVDGRLLKLAFAEGQDVRAGDVLALVDPAIYQAQNDVAVAKKAQDEATLGNARTDLQRYNSLAVGNIGSKQQADTQKALVAQLEAQVKGDQAAIDNAKATLDFATIRSPIDGRTGIRLVDPGNVIKGSDQTGIVVVTQLKPITVLFTLAQQYLRQVTDAQASGRVRAQALASDNAAVIDSGEVTVVDNQVDPTTGTVKIKAVFPNADLHLWPGQFVNVRLVTGRIPGALVVPSAAVQRGPNGAFVYVLSDDAAKLTDVTVGQQNERFAVVTGGLSAPSKVLTSGFARLTDAAKVRVIAAPPATAGAVGDEPVMTQPAGGAPPAPGATDGGERRGRGDGGGRRRGAAGGAGGNTGSGSGGSTQ